MPVTAPIHRITAAVRLPPETSLAVAADAPPFTAAGQAALPRPGFGEAGAAAATPADWTHFSDWCTAKKLRPVPAAPATVGAYLASLAESHAPEHRPPPAGRRSAKRTGSTTWPGTRGIATSRGRCKARCAQTAGQCEKAAALTLAMLRQMVATCDQSARGRRDRALLLFGFAGALRRSELVALHVGFFPRKGPKRDIGFRLTS